MAEMPNVVSLEVIESVWGNLIRDRTAQRYVDETSRDFENGTPTVGDLAFITSDAQLQFWTGTEWADLINSVSSTVREGGVLLWGGAAAMTFDTTEWKLQYDDGGGFLNRIVVGQTSVNLRGAGGFRVVTVSDDLVELAGGTILRQENGGRIWDRSVSSSGNYRLTRDDNGETTLHFGGGASGHSWIRLPEDASSYFQFRPATGSTPITRILSETAYPVEVDASSASMRDILIGEELPDNSWGKDGDIYIRFEPAL